MLKQKIVEDYFDASTYSNQEILQSIEETKKEFSKKIINVDINLNEFGVYVVTYYFKNKNNILQKIMVKLKGKNKKNKKSKKILLNERNETINEYKEDKIIEHKKTKEEKEQDKIKARMEKYTGNKYGMYKQTGTYKPY